jgi:hypothetical protein
MTKWHNLPEQLKNFEQAFTTSSTGCRRECLCGSVFYDSVGNYDWDEGEFEALEKNERATAVDYSVGTISFEGKEYCCDCDCWHERAKQIIRFLDGHAHKIAEWLTLEKKRKQEEADHSPVVK